MLRHWIVRPIKSPLLPVFLISVILEIDLGVFVAAAPGKIDDVSVARILRKEDGFFAQTIVIQVFVECSVTQMIGVEKVSSKGSKFLDDFEQLGRELVGAGLKAPALIGVAVLLAVATIIAGFFFEPLKREVPRRPQKDLRETPAYLLYRVTGESIAGNAGQTGGPKPSSTTSEPDMTTYGEVFEVQRLTPRMVRVVLGGEGSVATNGFWSALTIATTLRLHASLGTAFKEPTFYENFATAYSRGNPDLEPEQANSRDAGVAELLETDARQFIVAHAPGVERDLVAVAGLEVRDM